MNKTNGLIFSLFAVPLSLFACKGLTYANLALLAGCVNEKSSSSNSDTGKFNQDSSTLGDIFDSADTASDTQDCHDTGSEPDVEKDPWTDTGADTGMVSGDLYVDDDGGADYRSIQDAIDAASDGATVFVRPGTYYETLDVSKNLTLKSTNGADQTVVDASNHANSPVVTIAGNVWLEGFTIRGAHPDGACFYGGGIKITGASGQDRNYPVIQQNKIVENTACKVGGIYVAGFGSSDGEHVWNSATIRNNIIANNEAETLNAGAIGISTDYAVDTKIYNNVIANNLSVSGSGGIEIYGEGCLTDIRNNIFYGNQSSGNQNVIYDTYGAATIEYNLSYGNSADYTAGSTNGSADPLFVDETDFRLNASSPAVNAGDPSSDYTDEDGTTNDIGAYGGPRGSW